MFVSWLFKDSVRAALRVRMKVVPDRLFLDWLEGTAGKESLSWIRCVYVGITILDGVCSRVRASPLVKKSWAEESPKMLSSD